MYKTYCDTGNQNVKTGEAPIYLHQEEEGLIEKTEMTDSVLIADHLSVEVQTDIMMIEEWAVIEEHKGKY